MIHYDCLKSKPVLAVEILRLIKYKPDKSIHSDGTFDKRETFAIHQFIKRVSRKQGVKHATR